MSVEVENITRRFGTVTALNRVNLSIRQGEFFSFLGPSGCGKTTLLRLIAGLDFPDEGIIRISGQDASHTPAHLRPVNTVFQSYALFPHMSVRENIAFGLKMKKVPKGEMDQRIKRVIEMVQISDLADRRPSQLSGGQKQRVALARAIVNEPQVLLLDEPLGALDLKLRKQLQQELHGLQRRLGITFLYVTHDQDEALTMSDRIAVMKQGVVEQLGDAKDLYEYPNTRYVAQFLGSCNLIEGRVQTRSGTQWQIETSLGVLKTDFKNQDVANNKNEKVTLAIRPEKVLFVDSGSVESANIVSARVTDLVYSGAETTYFLEAGLVSLKMCVFNVHSHQPLCGVGSQITVSLPPLSLVLLDD